MTKKMHLQFKKTGIMKKTSSFLVGIVLLLSGCTQGELMIDGRAGFQIVIPDRADTIETAAAQQLKHYLFEMSRANLPVVAEGDYNGENAIYIGRTGFAKALDFDFGMLEEDGFAYLPRGNNFVIAGGAGKGTLYGVYELLESIGFRKYTSATMHIPKGNSITLPGNDTVIIPGVTHRTTNYRDTRDPGYSDWHKLSSRDNWGLFVHTFFNLVPPDSYMENHPEFYALRDGERLPTQLCLSNPDVADTLISNLRKKIEERPHMEYWSVSQEDNHMSCLCDNCVEMDIKYGGDSNRHSGSMIYFVNKVAREFPDKIISTLAYWYTRAAPDNIKPEPNVNIMLCNIESLRHKPVFETDPAFSNDLKNWGRLADDILIWDYNIQFSNLVSPFPNLHTIQPNIKFFTDNNVNAFFMQGNAQVGGEMAELRAYLISRLLWNPDADAGAIIDDFLNGYYGPAGPYIRQYIDNMQQALLESDHRLSIFGSPEEARETYLSAGMMDEYNRLFDQAEKAVEKDPELLRRVQIARLPLMHARIQISRTEIDTPRSMFRYDAGGRVVADPEIKTVLHQFVELSNEQGVTLLRERSITPDEFLESHNRIFSKLNEMDEAVSTGKKVIPITHPSSQYRPLEALTDGVFGSYEAWRDVRYDNWVGYEGEHMEFIVDLGEVMPVGSVNMDFFDSKDTWYTMFLPEYVTYSTSLDGQDYSEGVKVPSPSNPNEPYENISENKVYVQSFEADMKNIRARYIKVHASSILQCPLWHVRAGYPATIFSDEIVVK
jgi:hypothetical protein